MGYEVLWCYGGIVLTPTLLYSYTPQKNMIMEQKKYIAPAMEIAEIEMVSMLAASIGVSDEITEDDAVMSNRRRGTWGNLWAEDKEK